MDEKINVRIIGLLLVIWLILLGYLLLIPDLRESSDTAGAFITGGTAAQQPASISITMPDGRGVTYRHDAKQWQITKPYHATARQVVIRDLLAALQKTRIMEMVDEKPENLSRYGLEKGERIDVALAFDDGSTRTFHFGARLPLNQIYVYFQMEADPAVYRIWEGVRATLENYEAILEQGQPVQFDPSKITSLALRHRGTSLLLEKRGANWHVVAPVRRAADNEAVEAYLKRLLALTSSGASPPADPDRASPGGSDWVDLTLGLGGGGMPLRVHLAPQKPGGSPLLTVERGGVSTSYVANPGAVEQLSFEQNDFYLPVALSFDASDITQIRIRHPRYSLELGRQSDGSWQFYQPKNGQRADGDVVGQLLHLLGNLPIGHYLADDTGITDNAEPTIIVTLATVEDSATLKIVGKPGGHVRGTSDPHPGWYSLAADTVSRLEAFDPGALADRSLLAFDPRSVKQVVVRRSGNSSLLKRTESGWQWEAPKRKKARSAAVWKLVFDIRDMRYQREVVSEGAVTTNGDDCVIQDPDGVIEVKLVAEAAEEMELKAAETAKGWIVFSSRLPGCYRVERTSLDRVVSDVDILVEKP